jgi:hypothetical protein
VNVNTPRSPADLAAAVQLQRVPRAIVARVTELYDGGLSVFEIQAILSLPLPMIRLIIRGMK